MKMTLGNKRMKMKTSWRWRVRHWRARPWIGQRVQCTIYVKRFGWKRYTVNAPFTLYVNWVSWRHGIWNPCKASWCLAWFLLPSVFEWVKVVHNLCKALWIKALYKYTICQSPVWMRKRDEDEEDNRKQEDKDEDKLKIKGDGHSPYRASPNPDEDEETRRWRWRQVEDEE